MEQNNDIKTPFSNRNIDSFLMGSEFEINFDWGLAQLSQYTHELELLERGCSFADLGIAERRKSSLPSFLTPHSGAYILTDNTLELSDVEKVTPGSIAHLKLSGVMRSDDGLSSRGINNLMRDISKANQNPNIIGIIIEANTGGGESRSGVMLNSAIEGSEKPVIVLAHLLASAGIRGTLAADEIIASGTGAEFGSIGTYITYNKNFKEWYVSNYEDIYASKSVNKNKEFRAMLKGDIKPLTESVDKSNEMFLQEVKKYRPLTGDIDYILSGELFYAKEAKKLGLVDSIGNLNYAAQRVKSHVEMRKNQSQNG